MVSFLNYCNITDLESAHLVACVVVFVCCRVPYVSTVFFCNCTQLAPKNLSLTHATSRKLRTKGRKSVNGHATHTRVPLVSVMNNITDPNHSHRASPCIVLGRQHGSQPVHTLWAINQSIKGRQINHPRFRPHRNAQTLWLTASPTARDRAGSCWRAYSPPV